MLRQGRSVEFPLASPPHVHWPCPLPVVSKCSFDSLSLQKCLEEFLIGLLGLPAQLLFPLPPQSLSLNNGIGWKSDLHRPAMRSSRKHRTYQSLFLQQRCFPVEHKHWPDAEEEKLTDAVEESEEVGVLDTVAFTVPHPLYCLVQPYADVWMRVVKVNAMA